MWGELRQEEGGQRIKRDGRSLLASLPRSRWSYAILLAVTITALVATAVLHYRTIDRELTDAALSRRLAVAQLAAAALSEKLERLVDVTVSLATRVRFRQLVASGEWEEAIRILRDVPRDFPFADRLVLFNATGTVMADIPERLEVRGKNFAYRDWYQGVSRGWKPHVSEVYRRAAPPPSNVFAVAVPIRAGGGRVAGILQLQTRPESYFKWARGIEVGPGGFIYIVDRRGRVAFHPKLPAQGEIADFTGVPAVRRVLGGDSGIEIAFDPTGKEDAISAYAPVPKYGWGVVVQQPKRAAFAARDQQIGRLLTAYGLTLLFFVLGTYLAARIVVQRRRAQEDRQLATELEQRVAERTAQLEAANRELERSRKLIREKGERDLHASEERYRYLFEANPMPMWVLDAETLRFLAVNDAVLETYGYTRDEFLSITAYDLRTPEDLPAYRDYIRTRDPRSHTHRLTRHRRKDGSVRDVETTVHAIDFQGRPARLSLVNDVTDRLRAEAALRDSEQRYRYLFELAPAPIIVRKRDRVVYANPAAVRFFGARGPEELAARSWLSLIQPDERDEARQRMRDVDERGVLTPPRERRFLRMDGSPTVGETSAIAMPFGGERLAIVAIHDVTERLRAEEEVRRLNTELERRIVERTAQLNAVVETANDAIISADGQGRIVYFNRGAERAFGYSAREAAGLPLTALMPQRFHEAHRAGFERFLSTGEARIIGKIVELVARKRDGTEFPVELSLANWTAPQGTFFTAIVRDITDRRKAEEALKKINEQLTAANKELESFSYSVSHDLRSPLRAIDGFARILTEDYGAKFDDEGRRLLGVVRDNSQKMGGLIDDLLAFSRLGRKPLSPAPIDMKRLVENVIEELEMPQGKRPDLVLGALPPAHGDEVLLKQVWANLLANAVKFSGKRERPLIEVTGRDNGAETVYCVKDNGAGFDMQYYDKLFGVFQRLHRTEEFAGTGVGLAIVERVVLRHGGRAWAEGRVGEGAIFCFSLPRGGLDGQV